jgi:hypothetical protein
MRRRFSLRGYLQSFFQRHLFLTLGIGLAAMIYLTVLSFLRLIKATGTAHGDWALTVAVGLAASPTLIGVAAGAVWWSRRRRADTSRLTMILTVVIGAIFLADMAYTRPAVVPAIGPPETVTTPFQLGAIAFMVPVYCAIVALLGFTFAWHVRNRRDVPAAWHTAGTAGRPPAASAGRPPELLTGFISPGRRGWAVTWVGEGRIPQRVTAATLTATADEATGAAARLYRHWPAGAGAQLQLAICPESYRSGPTLEVAGAPGAFTATDPHSGKIFQGAALEDLIADVEVDGAAIGDFMLHWTRPVTTLSPPVSGTGHPPAPAG